MHSTADPQNARTSESGMTWRHSMKLTLVAVAFVVFFFTHARLCAGNSGAIPKYALLFSALLLILLRFVFHLGWGSVWLAALFFGWAYFLMPCVN